jgi:hypothetical protein
MSLSEKVTEERKVTSKARFLERLMEKGILGGKNVASTVTIYTLYRAHARKLTLGKRGLGICFFTIFRAVYRV